jgi:cysteine synthase
MLIYFKHSVGWAIIDNTINPRGGIWKAAKVARDSPNVFNTNQCDNPAVNIFCHCPYPKLNVQNITGPDPTSENYEAHVRWTGPQLLAQLPQGNVIAVGMGTTGGFHVIFQHFDINKSVGCRYTIRYRFVY